MTDHPDLPPGWEWTTLGELGDYLNGRGFKRSEWSRKGRPIIRIQNLTGTGESHNYFSGEIDERYLVRPGDLLLSWAATLGAYRWRGPEGVLNQHIFRVSSFIDEDFHYYLLQHSLDALQRHAHGSGMVHITRGRFDSLPVRLPPLAEQRRIVAALENHLSRVDSGESQIDAVRRRLTMLRSRVLTDAVAGSLVPRSSERAEDGLSSLSAARQGLGRGRRGPTAPELMDGYSLPDGWAWASLGDLSYDFGYGTSTKCAYGAPGSPVLRIPNIQRGRVDASDLKNAIDDTLDLSKLFLRPGDLLFVRTNGSRDLIGRAAAVQQAMKVAFASYLIRFRLIAGVTDPEWVALVVSSRLWRNHLESRAASSAGQYNLSTRVLAPLGIPVPPPEEQKAILARVNEYLELIERLDHILDAVQKRSSLLRRSLLVEAFGGRLVEQDPNDEPASELLARIRAERACAPARRSTRSPRTRRQAPAPSHSAAAGSYQEEELPL